MKKIIDYKLYDTDTAETIVTWRNGYPKEDIRHCLQKLYRTNEGRWFLYGEGGYLSIYGTIHESIPCGGRDVFAFTDGEAFVWLAKRNFVDEVQQYFPDRIRVA